MLYRPMTATAGAPPTSPFLRPLDFLLPGEGGVQGGQGQVTVWFPSSHSAGSLSFCSRMRALDFFMQAQYVISLVTRPPDPPLVDWPKSPLHRGNSGRSVQGGFLALCSRQVLRADTISVGFWESISPHPAAVKNHFSPPRVSG